MEISRFSSSEMEGIYISCLFGISVLYTGAGLCAIQITGLSNSVSLPVMSLFKYCFELFTLYSIIWGFLVTSRPRYVSRESVEPASGKYLVEDSAVKFIHLVLVLFLLITSCLIDNFFSKYVSIFFTSPFCLFLCYQRCFPSHWMKLLSGILNSSSLDPFTTWLQIYMSAHDQKTNFLLPLWSTNAAAMGRKIRDNKKIVKTIKFAVGMSGSVLFQNYFKLNSFEEASAFLSFAMAWLANITLLSVTNDFGVFNFILGNVVVGSTVAEGGLGAHTWLAVTASVLLYSLRLILESVPSIRGRFMYIRVKNVNFLLLIIFYYGAYLVLFVYRTRAIPSDSRPFS